MDDEKSKPKKPTAAEILSNAPRRDTHGSGNPHLQPGELQKVWRPGLKPDKPKK
jgi:hypothetical protein